MGIDPALPVFREITTSAVPHVSLTRTEQELQTEEGVSPLDVAETEQSSLRWQKEKDPRERRKKRQEQLRDRTSLESSAQDEVKASGGEQPEPMQVSTESVEEETGTLFDDRS